MMNFLIIASLYAFTLEFQAPDLKKSGGGTIPFVEDLPMQTEYGRPWLPVKNLLVALPENGKFPKIRILAADTMENVYVSPSPIPLPTDREGKLEFSPPDPKIYNSGSLYPSEPYSIKPGRIADVRVAAIKLYPVQFDPVGKRIIFNRKIEIEWETAPVNVPASRLAFLKRIVANGELLVRTAPKTTGFDYLIITSGNLAPAWQPLIRWKTRKGHRVALRTIEWIRSNYSGRDDAEALRNYLKTALDSGLVYVLLGGDTDVLPYRKAFAVNSEPTPQEGDTIPTDLYFSDLDGTWDANGNNVFGEVDDSVDMLPDVFVGRAPVSTSQEVSVFVNKVIAYESQHAPNYSGTALFAASYLDESNDGGVLKDMIAAEVEPEVSVMKLYERFGNLTANSLIGFLNYGYNFVNHEGHGNTWMMQAGPDYIYMDAFNELTNAPKYVGVFYSIGCWVASFDYDCIAERFVKAPNGGGFFIGNSRYGWYIPQFMGYSSTDRMDIEFFHQVVRNRLQQLGVALASVKALYAPQADGANTFRWSEYAVNLLGDPDLYLPTAELQQMEVSMSGRPVSGRNNLAVTVTAPTGEPIPDARVTVFQNDSVLTRGVTGPDGTCYLEFEAASGWIEVAVWKDGYVFHDDTVTVQSSNIQLVEITYGGDDGVMSFGESSPFTVKLVNRSGEPVQDFSLAITAGPCLSLDSSRFTTPSFGVSDTFVVSTTIHAGDSTCNSHVRLVISGANLPADTMEQPITVFGFRLSFSIASISDGTPYSTARLRVVNTGAAEVSDLWLHPIPISAGLSFPDDSLQVGSIAPGDSTTIDLSFQLDTVACGSNFAMFRLEPFSDTLWLSSGYVGYSFDFEDGVQGWTVESPWHLTAHRSHSGQQSLYFGNEGSWQYPPNVMASITSPWMVVGINPHLKFWTYFETQAGWDFGIVRYKVNGDTDYRFVASLDGQSTTWKQFDIPLTGLRPGTEIQLTMTFYSEDNEVQLEGWYIDDVTLTSTWSSTGISEPGYVENPAHHGKLWVTQRGNLLDVRWNGALNELQLFDVTGRLILSKTVSGMSGKTTISVNSLPGGIYFVVGRGRNSLITRKVLHLR